MSKPYFTYETSVGDQTVISVRAYPDVSQADYKTFLDNVIDRYQPLIETVEEVNRFYDGSFCCIIRLNRMVLISNI